MEFEILKEEYNAQKKAFTGGEFMVEVADVPVMDVKSDKMVVQFKFASVANGKVSNYTCWMEKDDKETGKRVKQTWQLEAVLKALKVPYEVTARGLVFDEVACLGKQAIGVFGINKNKPTWTGRDDQEHPNIQLLSIKDPNAKPSRVKASPPAGEAQELPF